MKVGKTAMNYQEALDWIHSREKFKVKPGLKRMDWMMERLGHPEKGFKAIHVAGTNGKGSTVSFLRNLLQAQGYTVGTFTSPYIERFNERISLNGEPVSDAVIARLVDRIRPLAESLKETPLGEPTEFEIITAMAMIYFDEQPIDYAVVETGLGGRYDSTNILHPIVSVITNIGHDHMNILGSTVREIAGEKAGIIKQKVPVVTAVKQPEAMEVILEEATSQKAPLFSLTTHFHVTHEASTPEGETFIFRSGAYESELLLSRMKGHHQVENASVALQTMESLKQAGDAIDRRHYRSGLEQTTWPARFETVRNQPLTIIDGAHNEEGTKALVDTVKEHYRGRSVVLVYAALEDKPVIKMMNQLKEVVDFAVVTSFDFPRALQEEDLASLSPIKPTLPAENLQEALRLAEQQLDDKSVLLITGSLYFISDVRAYFKSKMKK